MLSVFEASRELRADLRAEVGRSGFAGSVLATNMTGERVIGVFFRWDKLFLLGFRAGGAVRWEESCEGTRLHFAPSSAGSRVELLVSRSMAMSLSFRALTRSCRLGLARTHSSGLANRVGLLTGEGLGSGVATVLICTGCKVDCRDSELT